MSETKDIVIGNMQPRADLETLCRRTAQTVLQAMLQRINAKNMTQGEA